jgi:hypothetical protein
MSKRLSQCDRVLAYIKEHGYITDNDAHDDLGVNRLSGRVYDLKDKGYDIRLEWRSGRNRYGRMVRYGAYYLGDGKNE